MAKAIKTTTRRIEFYVGPDVELKRDELARFEGQGYMAQPKVDGMFCMLEVGRPSEGRPNRLKSRDATTPDVTGSNAGNIPWLEIPLPEGTIIIGELEAASQWSKEQNTRAGIRRMWLFDIVRYGQTDWRTLGTKNRYEKLIDSHLRFSADLCKQLLLVPAVYGNFTAYYDACIKAGFEGIVLKPVDSPYSTHRSDGKRDDWYRCKKVFSDEFVLIGTAMTPGGKYSAPKPNGIWGLWDTKFGRWQEIMRTGMRTAAEFEGKTESDYFKPEFFGKLVVEFQGWERFKSGALRHAQSVRVRHDKTASQCVLKNAQKAA